MKSNPRVEKSPIDVSEHELRDLGTVLATLLIDKSSGKKIIWATDSYVQIGPSYKADMPIQARQITGRNRLLIQPRASKSRAEQTYRKREKAEVFTPLRVVERMNSTADKLLGHEEATDDNWTHIVNCRKLEVTCGEGPFIAGRYDPTAQNQKVIKSANRVGFLDRKMQAIHRFVHKEREWREQTLRALQSSYGYEWQGDSLLIARENVLQTVIDFYEDKFGRSKSLDLAFLEECAEIIAWNIFQMDGIKFVIPMSCVDVQVTEFMQSTLFGDEPLPRKEKLKREPCPGCAAGGAFGHNGKVVKIKDWETGEVFNFNSMLLQ